MPEILCRIQSDQCSDKETDEFDASYTADAESCHEQPEKPLRLKTLVLEPMKFGPTQGRGDSAAEEHRIEKDESADGRVRVLAENHERDEPHRRTPEIELLCCPVSHRDANGTEKGVELAHEGVVDFFRIGFARLKFERPIVSSKVARETNEKFS